MGGLVGLCGLNPNLTRSLPSALLAAWTEFISFSPTYYPLSIGWGGLPASAAHASCSASSSCRLAAGSGPGTDQGWPLGEGGSWLRRTGAGAAGGAGAGELLGLATPACLSSFGTTSDSEDQCRSPTCLTCCHQRDMLSQSRFLAANLL